jgi:hypothetical protein
MSQYSLCAAVISAQRSYPLRTAIVSPLLCVNVGYNPRAWNYLFTPEHVLLYITALIRAAYNVHFSPQILPTHFIRLCQWSLAVNEVSAF